MDLDQSVGPSPRRWRTWVRALSDPRTFAPHRNPWFCVGLAWGVPIPLVTLAIECRARGLGFGWAGVAQCFAETPVQWLLLAHPLLFATVFGAFGTVLRVRGRRVTGELSVLRSRAEIDALTGLANHRTFFDRLGEELGRTARAGQPLAVLMVDLDRFKSWNDRHGHQAGDHLLAAVGRRIRGVVRTYDTAARYGGEEFSVVLPGLGAGEALAAGERVRTGIASLPLLPGHPHDRVTVSVGVAVRRPGEGPAGLVARADAALYRAKREGRDRVCIDDLPGADSPRREQYRGGAVPATAPGPHPPRA